MDNVKRLPSSVFRVTYPGLDEPVAVTVVGRVIGHWVPISAAIDERFASGIRPGEPESPSGASGPVSGTRSTPQVSTDASRDPSAHPGTSETGMTQREKDAVLRKVRSR